jgi:hypothetical protein
MTEGDIIGASGNIIAPVLVYVLIINDRHTDPEVRVFATPDAAVAEAARTRLGNRRSSQRLA